MNKSTIWFITVILIGAFAAGVYLLYKMAPKPVAIDNVFIEPNDWVRGMPGAKVEILEYADLQCPACAAIQPTLKQLLIDYAGKVRMSYRHFPLKSIHRNAVPSAIAAEAAGKQGKFFEMIDLLYEKRTEWSDASDPGGLFKQYAKDLQLDEKQFENDLGSAELAAKVEQHYDSALKFGLDSTPTFFINGRKIANPANYEQWKELINAELAK